MSDDTQLRKEMERAKAEFWRQPEAALQIAAAAITTTVTAKPTRDLNKKVVSLRAQAAEKAGSITKEDALQLTEDLKQAIMASPITGLKTAYQDYLAMVAQLLQTCLSRDATPGELPYVGGQPTPSTQIGGAHVAVVGALAAQYAKGFPTAIEAVELPLAVFAQQQGRFGTNTLEAVQLKAYWLRGLNQYDTLSAFLSGMYSVDDASTLAQSDAGSAVGATMAWTAFAHEHDLEKARRIAVQIEDRMRERAGRKHASPATILQFAEVLVAASYPHTPGDPAKVPHDQRLAKLQEAESLLREQHRVVAQAQGRRSDSARVFDDRLQLVRMLRDKPVDESLWDDVKAYLDQESPRRLRDLSDPALRCEQFFPGVGTG